MSNVAFQLQIDGNLAQKTTEILSRLGLDLQFAVQLFLNRYVQAQGIPFSMRLANNSNGSYDAAIAAMMNMSRISEEAGIADMTLYEINAEIDAVRRGERD